MIKMSFKKIKDFFSFKLSTSTGNCLFVYIYTIYSGQTQSYSSLTFSTFSLELSIFADLIASHINIFFHMKHIPELSKGLKILTHNWRLFEKNYMKMFMIHHFLLIKFLFNFRLLWVSC